MKFTKDWLDIHLKSKKKESQIIDKLNNIGLEVEKIEPIKNELSDFIVAKIVKANKHPNADRLKITTVDIGQDELLQIICGAPNVDKNQTVAVATAGTTLYPNNEKLKIKKSKIRGEVSNGMICGQDELNLGEFDQGIMIFDDKYKVSKY